jgi:F0F1-type ATP synthase alpha subunit
MNFSSHLITLKISVQKLQRGARLTAMLRQVNFVVLHADTQWLSRQVMVHGCVLPVTVVELQVTVVAHDRRLSVMSEKTKLCTVQSSKDGKESSNEGKVGSKAAWQGFCKKFVKFGL